ncbi:MAG: Phosphoglycerol transferase [uncultured Rubrobacteraceae bacterium]|uniref:Phosphoglycerol transferase n=1 Tax=uncultured Rubrobacteraceae bacterium TaxID=349277 RepID=A0A6J4QSG2_9ACTN|nr:MAG: Phosphoglycerol transferase [uncultured Rubrobacteraceae bacterium]
MSLLSRRDWTYLLSLLVPFLLYDLVLKGYLVVSWPKNLGFTESLGLMRSDLLFSMGYALLWIGLFALAREGLWRRMVTILFHAAKIFVALLATIAYQYFKVTGSTLDFGFILISLSSPGGLTAVVESEVSPGILALLAAVLAYAVLGPFLVTSLVARWRGWADAEGTQTANIPWLHLAGVGLAAYALFSFSLVPGASGSTGAPSKSFSRDALVHVAATAAGAEYGEGSSNLAADSGEPTPEASLRTTGGTERRNVVLVHLESTRAQSMTPYNEDLETAPFLDELAESSLLAERAYAVVPHTTNAMSASNCGISPPLNPWQTASLGDNIPSRCLADLLEEQGYNSVWFTSSVSTFEIERLPELVENLGYEEFYPVETMDTEGFEEANYFGYEDDVMLGPSEEWLEGHKDGPFVATYETIGPHHQYLAPEKRYGREEFDEEDLVNRYLNSLRNQDFFLQNLFEQYKKLGLYEDTVFLLYGDHGEAFGEHGRYQHDNVPYEEGVKIPLLVHDPGRFENGERVEAPVSQLDLLPTVVDLLGYEIEGGAYEGSSILRPLPEERTLMFGCWNESGCLASLEETEKYVYHFGDNPDEIFELSEDPDERRNLAEEWPEEAEERRRELLEWRAEVSSRYGTRAAP